jgi:predicted RNA-binding Zn-ribbon protein involved in translation (DUF1610 family)
MSDETYRVILRQSGGKYGKFDCPKCGKQNQYWKFSSNHGFCNAVKGCGSMYQSVGSMYPADKETTADHRAIIEEVY